MIKNNIEYLYQLEKSGQTNLLDSDIWIINIEKVFFKGKYFLKILVHQNIEILDKLKGVTFKVTFNGNVVFINCFEFSKVEKIDDPALFGCLLEMPEQYSGGVYFTEISSYVLLNEEIKNEQPKIITVKLENEQREIEINKYLSRSIKNYIVFPKIDKEYWLCSCGNYNSTKNSECKNCKNEKSYIENLVKIGLPSLFVNSYITNEYKNLNLNVSVEKNIEQLKSKLHGYFSEIKNVDIKFDEKMITNEYDNQKNQLKINSRNKKKWIVSLSILIALFFSITVYINIKKAEEQKKLTEELKEIWNGSWYNTDFPSWVEEIDIEEMTVTSDDVVSKIISVDKNSLEFDVWVSDENWYFTIIGNNLIEQNQGSWTFRRK